MPTDKEILEPPDRRDKPSTTASTGRLALRHAICPPLTEGLLPDCPRWGESARFSGRGQGQIHVWRRTSSVLTVQRGESGGVVDVELVGRVSATRATGS